MVLGERSSTSSSQGVGGSDRGSDTGSDFTSSRPTSGNYSSIPSTPISKYVLLKTNDTSSDTHLFFLLISDPRLSIGSQPVIHTPTYVAELTEAQAFIADIPPLVSKPPTSFSLLF